MSDPLYTPYPAVYSMTIAPDQPVEVTAGLLAGGAIIQNPRTAQDQGLTTEQNLRIDMIDNTNRLQDSIVLVPGNIFRVPKGFQGTVWATSHAAGHQF